MARQMMSFLETGASGIEPLAPVSASRFQEPEKAKPTVVSEVSAYRA